MPTQGAGALPAAAPRAGSFAQKQPHEEPQAGSAAACQTGGVAAAQPRAPQAPNSAPDKRGCDMMNGGSSAGGLAPMLNGGGKRPRLAGDQHFLQQPLSVAQ